MESQNKLKIGISSCLLGHRVRFDGEGKRHRWVTDSLSQHAELLFLSGNGDGSGSTAAKLFIGIDSESKELSLKTSKTGEDFTAK